MGRWHQVGDSVWLAKCVNSNKLVVEDLPFIYACCFMDKYEEKCLVSALVTSDLNNLAICTKQ